MITRILYEEEKDLYDSVISHPIQTWAWGDFLKTQGHTVYRLGVFEKNKLVFAYSINFHSIPKLAYTVGVLQRGPKIDQDMLLNIEKIAKQEKAIFIKIEPDVVNKIYTSQTGTKQINPLPDFSDLVLSPKTAFYPHSHIIDLSKSTDTLLAQMHPKTRYNIKVANRHGVEVVEDNSQKGFDEYLNLLFETTKRQGFYLHSQKYHQSLWQTLKNTGMIHIFLAKFQGELLTAMMFLKVKDRFYYPYGASSDKNRQVMASTLTMWEAIKTGKELGCTHFDMWGSLPPDAKPTDRGYGFHHFKEGFGGQLVQFVGSFDYIIDPSLYKLYTLVDSYRWKFLRFKANLFRF